MSSIVLRRVVCRVLALSAFAFAWRAEAQETRALSGQWSASPLTATWNVGDWGAACGPRPGGGGEPGGNVTITETGKELTISGLGRKYSTGECWERYPGLSRVSHSTSGRSWRNVCKTSAADPRQATLITSLTATDTTISFDETGQYQFVIQGQNCTASVRRARSLRRIQPKGEEPPAEPAEPSPAESAAEPAARCATVGPPARLEVRPSRKLMRAGENFQFRSAVLDARGCPTRTAPAWTITGDPTAVKLLAPGKIEVGAGTAEGTIELVVSAVGRSVKVTVEVVGSEQYEALLRAGSFNRQGESEEAAVASITTGGVGAGTVATRDRSRQRRNVFIAAIGAAAVLVGVLGVVVSLRQRRLRKNALKQAELPPLPPLPRSGPAKFLLCPTCREEYPPEAQFCPKDGNRLRVPEAHELRQPAGGVCPVCGQGFDPGVQFCPEHREELVPAAAYHAMRAAAPPPTRKICPVCGAQYGGETRFCGSDGAELVPIN